jgi:hypothetical protein
MIVFHDKMSPNLELIRQTNLSLDIKKSYDTYPWFRFTEEYIVKPKTNDPIIDQAQEKRDEKFLNVDRKLKNGGFDCLVVVSMYDPIEILATLQPYLQPSGNVVVYSSVKEMVLPVYDVMRNSKDFMFTNLYEGFMREYQVSVLESGIHPLMNMEGGGFIGFGVKVCGEGVEVVKTEKKVKRMRQR